MAKRKNKIVDRLRAAINEAEIKPTWLSKIERARSFEEISEGIKDFKLVLESNLGNREEDIVENETSGDIPDTDDDYLAG